MKSLHLKYRSIDEKKWLGMSVKEDDVDIVIDEDVIVYLDNVPVAAYGEFPLDKKLLQWCNDYKFPTVRRRAFLQGKEFKNEHGESLGLSATHEQYFGFKVPRPVYNIAAGPTRTTIEEKDTYKRIIKMSDGLIEKFSSFLPEQYERQRADIASTIMPQWRIGGGIFTQAVVNKKNIFPYHYDANNCQGHMNAMVCFNYGMSGGNTVVPILNAKFKMKGCKFLIFLAQNVLHGVSPVAPLTDFAMRYSIVFYAHELMKRVGQAEDELEKARSFTDKRFDEGYRQKRKAEIIKKRRKAESSGYVYKRHRRDEEK